MLTKAQLLASMRHETHVIRHLASKAKPEMLDWRPTPVQRSLIELLRYMARMAIVPAVAVVKGGWDHAEAMEAETASMPLEDFGRQMQVQIERLDALLDGVDEKTAATDPAVLPWGTPTTVGAAFIDMVLKPLVAYRMQLFLYLKQAGLSELGPAQCWVGVDPPPAAKRK